MLQIIEMISWPILIYVSYRLVLWTLKKTSDSVEPVNE
jgi:hypothetical protein